MKGRFWRVLTLRKRRRKETLFKERLMKEMIRIQGLIEAQQLKCETCGGFRGNIEPQRALMEPAFVLDFQSLYPDWMKQ